MPWKTTDVPMERAAFITEYRKGCWSMTDLCEAFGISRKTGYALLERHKNHGVAALTDRSRAPHTHPNKTPREIEEKIIALREKCGWGAKKLIKKLSGLEPKTKWPARSTVDRILAEADLVRPRKRKRRAAQKQRRMPAVTAPNDLWCQDYKGWFRLGNGTRCDPYTLTDRWSRFALRCKALVSPKLEDVQECLKGAFREFGLPDAILQDNGPPFGAVGSLGGLTRLGVWLLRLGVTPYFIDPGRPEQNGQHERFHLTLQEATTKPPKRTLRAQQMAFNRFLSEFNYERPHEALDLATPGEVYVASRRDFPRQLPEWSYPDDYRVRRVRCCGQIKWRGQSIRLGQAFVGESVGVDAVGDGVFQVYLGTLALGRFHEGSRKVIPLPD